MDIIPAIRRWLRARELPDDQQGVRMVQEFLNAEGIWPLTTGNLLSDRSIAVHLIDNTQSTGTNDPTVSELLDFFEQMQNENLSDRERNMFQMYTNLLYTTRELGVFPVNPEYILDEFEEDILGLFNGSEQNNYESDDISDDETMEY